MDANADTDTDAETDTGERQIAPGAERENDNGRTGRAAPAPRGIEQPRLQVSGTQVAAGALASVSAAVVASHFGTAGTVAGTGLASVVTTVGAAVYSAGLRRTSARLRQTGSLLPIPPIRPALPRTRLDRWRAWLRQRRWGVAAGGGLVFVLALALVTLVELVGQRPLSGIVDRDASGTTSIGSVARGENDPGGGDGSDGGDDRSPSGTSTSTSTIPGTSTSTPSSSPPEGESGMEPPDTSGSSTTTSPRTPTSSAEPPTTTAPEPPASGDQSTPTSAG
jgi:hypothetical protein